LGTVRFEQNPSEELALSLAKSSSQAGKSLTLLLAYDLQLILLMFFPYVSH
jgi:hypothetical protein